jgi:hypothetical protein
MKPVYSGSISPAEISSWSDGIMLEIYWLNPHL